MGKPKVSVIVLNWNGKEFIQKCLQSLEKVSYLPLEIIVVDNNSKDGSQAYIKKNYPEVRLIENRENYGFAKGNNIGFKASSGKYIVFLNNDTQVTPEFIQKLLDSYKQDPNIGCIQPQMRIMEQKDTIDVVGAYLTFTGFSYHFGFHKKITENKYQQKREIFSAKGACIFFPRKVLEKTGVFDEDFFIFFEETDLCFRVWLAGFKVMYEPTSLIYHHGGGDTEKSDTYRYQRRVYLTFRNMICSYLKNFGTRNLITIFPLLVLVHLFVIGYFIIKLKPEVVIAIFSSYKWNMLHIKETLIKRYFVQKKLRKIDDARLNKHIMRNPRLSYYYYLMTGLGKYNE